MPTADDDGPRRIPRSVDLVLVLLQADQPPAAPAHSDRSDETAHKHAQKTALPRPGRNLARSGRLAVGSAQNHAHAAAGANDKQHGENDMVLPRPVARITSEDGEQTEDLDREEGQTEDLTGGGQAAREHGRGHEGGIGGEGGDGELVHADPGAGVVEKEDVDGQEPKRHGPDAVGGGGAGEGFEDGRQSEEGEVNEDGRFDGVHPQVGSAAAEGRRGPVSGW